jgi:hypothetical protein
MSAAEAAVAVASVLAGFAVGYWFRGWFGRRVESRRTG